MALELAGARDRIVEAGAARGPTRDREGNTRTIDPDRRRAAILSTAPADDVLDRAVAAEGGHQLTTALYFW